MAPNRYSQIIEHVFDNIHVSGEEELLFERAQIEDTATELGIDLPKNLSDVIYTFRHRSDFPESIQRHAPEGREWIIRSKGRGRYAFALIVPVDFHASSELTPIKIPDATPGVISLYALDDEQAQLARLRYARLIDIFLGITCYPLQSHLRTSVPDRGQIETDDIYIGIDRHGAHYVIPVQAKSPRDRPSAFQVLQDFAMCEAKFPKLICLPVAVQFESSEMIVLSRLTKNDPDILAISDQMRCQLVSPDDIRPDEQVAYQKLWKESGG